MYTRSTQVFHAILYKEYNFPGHQYVVYREHDLCLSISLSSCFHSWANKTYKWLDFEKRKNLCVICCENVVTNIVKISCILFTKKGVLPTLFKIIGQSGNTIRSLRTDSDPFVKLHFFKKISLKCDLIKKYISQSLVNHIYDYREK